MVDSIQALSNEVARLNNSSTLWAQPQIQSQSYAAAAMTQPQPQMQDYMMQQYAYANPGSMAPGHMYADPTAANYALQQQHFMNPYQARFYGGQFNEGMPGAELHTSSRLGLYRQGYTGPQAGGFVKPSFFSDTLALSGYRSYAGYESPYHEQVAASRRMVERGESAAALAIGIGGFAASYMMGGPVGIVAGLVGEVALQATVGNYMQRRKETGEVHEIMRDLVSGAGSTGVFGRGVDMKTAADMVNSMRRSAAADPYHSIEDYKEVLRTGAATGLFNYEDSGDEVATKVKKSVKSLNMLMMLFEDPDVQSTIKRMADFQAMGIPMHQMERMATDIKSFSHLANASFEEVMSQGASAGAQQAQMMGGSAAMGMRVGGMAMGMANRLVQSGFMQPHEVARRGGKSGIAQAARTQTISHIDKITGLAAAYMMDRDGTFDPSKLEEVVNSRDFMGVVQKSLSSFNNMDAATYMMNYGDVKAQAQGNLTPAMIIKMKDIYKEWWQTTYGRTENEYFLAHGGESGAKIMQYEHSADYKASQLRSDLQTSLVKASKRHAEQQMAERPWNRGLRRIKVWWDDFTDHGLSEMAADAQEDAAAWKTGIVRRKYRGDQLGLDLSKEELTHLRQYGVDVLTKDGEMDLSAYKKTDGWWDNFKHAMVGSTVANKGLAILERNIRARRDLATVTSGTVYSGYKHNQKQIPVEDEVDNMKANFLEATKQYRNFMRSLITKDKDGNTYIKKPLVVGERKERLEHLVKYKNLISSGPSGLILDPTKFNALDPEDQQLLLEANAQDMLTGELKTAISKFVLTGETAAGAVTNENRKAIIDRRDANLKDLGLSTNQLEEFVKLSAAGVSKDQVLQFLKEGTLPKDASQVVQSRLHSLNRSLSTTMQDKLGTAEGGKLYDAILKDTGSLAKEEALTRFELKNLVTSAGFMSATPEGQRRILESADAFQRLKDKHGADKIVLEAQGANAIQAYQDSDMGTNMARTANNTQVMKQALLSLAARPLPDDTKNLTEEQKRFKILAEQAQQDYTQVHAVSAKPKPLVRQ